MGATRKKEIYDICVEFGAVSISATIYMVLTAASLADVIIVEDDPYYFLQEGNYIPKAQRNHNTDQKVDDEEAAFIASLAPSYLKSECCSFSCI